MTDLINHPAYYAEGWSNGAEVIDITENLSFNRGNAVKYVARAGKKGSELEDLKKARWYIDREIDRLEDKSFDKLIEDLLSLPDPAPDWWTKGHTITHGVIYDEASDLPPIEVRFSDASQDEPGIPVETVEAVFNVRKFRVGEKVNDFRELPAGTVFNDGIGDLIWTGDRVTFMNGEEETFYAGYFNEDLDAKIQRNGPYLIVHDYGIWGDIEGWAPYTVMELPQ